MNYHIGEINTRMINLSTKIKKINVEPGKRILVVSDVHGYLHHLKKALEKAKFAENDILFIVGDMIEKGPDSLGTLRYVMKLYEKGNVIPLIGNVDAYRLQIIYGLNEASAPDFFNYVLSHRKWAGASFYEQLCAECGYVLNSPEDLLAAKDAVIERFREEFEFLASLPTVVETQNFVFVHGGLRDKNVYDNEKRGIFELTKYDAFMSNTPHVFDKYVIVGHWPVPLYNGTVQQLDPIIDREKRIISIDGGCGVKKECQLNLLVIPDAGSSVDEISFTRYDEFPTVTASENQAGSGDSIHISWLNRGITMLERGEEFSFAEHTASGKKLYIPNSYLRNDTECSDYTDLLLEVKKGDTLSLITQTSKGCIVKKDGVIGWYCGDIQK